MVSKIVILGLPVMLIGIIIGSLGLFYLPPFAGSQTIQVNQTLRANGGEYMHEPWFYYQATALPHTRVNVMLAVSVSGSFTVAIYYRYASDPTKRAIAVSKQYDYGPTEQTKVVQLEVLFNSIPEDIEFSFYIRNDNSQSMVVGEVVVRGVQMVIGCYVWYALGLIGLIVTIIGAVKGGKKRARAPIAAPAWEPTLQWGPGGKTGGTTKKQPKIKKKKKKVVTKKKVTKRPTAGGSGKVPCKFCGKPVSPNAFFCEHCYAKLR